MRVCKFGGSALRRADDFRRVKALTEAAPDRRVIVPSAPGKRDRTDEKITDLLYACQSAAESGRGFGHLFDRVAARYREIAAGLGLPAPDGDLRQIYIGLRRGEGPAWAASRGEWLCGRLLAAWLGAPFIDAADVIRFDENGRLLAAETETALHALPAGSCVLPGFYGADAAGRIHTFPRGGSDVTAALAAAACNADLYENWKDVPGIFAADPALVPDALCAGDMTYRELRALSMLGAQVICEEAAAPLRAAGIALNIRSFAQPDHPGTWVRPAFGAGRRAAAIGVTGRDGLSLWRLERIDGGADLARTALKAGLPLDRLAADADALCLTLRREEALPPDLPEKADAVWHHPHAAAVSVVGEELKNADGAARLSAALSAAGTQAFSLHMPPDGLYITAVVARDDYRRAVNAAYDAFIRR